MTEPESMEHIPERRKRQPADEMLAEARQSIYELPDTAALAGVSALGDSIVDALTTEFAIEEVPAPDLGERPATKEGKRGPAHAAPATAAAASARAVGGSAAAAPSHAPAASSAAPAHAASPSGASASAATPAPAHPATAARGDSAAVAAPASPAGSPRVSAAGSPRAASGGSTSAVPDGSARSAAAGSASAGSTDADATVAIPRVASSAAEGKASKRKPVRAGAPGNAADTGTQGNQADAGDNRGVSSGGDYDGYDGYGDYDDVGDYDGYDDEGYGDEGAPGSPFATAEMEPIEDEAFEPAVPAKKKRRRISVGKVVAALCILLALAVVGCGAYFTWDRWYRYDDAADIQGEWQTTNAQRTLVIDASHLKISEDVAYDYELDTKHKTITYSFGNSSGTATYRFSDDRQVLVIEENGETDWMMALHLKDDPVLSGSEVPEGTSKLVRLSDDIMATPKSLDDTSDGTEVYEEPFYVGGYTEYTQTEKPGTDSKKDDEKDKDGEDSDTQDEDSEDLEPGQDPEADYFDSERALNFYYDDSQMLYYDQYGNYYYDMYGNNPYELPLDDGSSDTYVEEIYYDPGYYEEAYY